MKKLYILIGCLIIYSYSFSQEFYNDFNDGTLQGWTNVDGTTNQLTIEEETFFYLQKVCDGTNSPIGEMAIINNDENYWAGNYFYEVIDTDVLHNIDEIIVKNDNDFDIQLRYGFKGANGYIVVTTEPINIPASSDWAAYEQFFGLEFPILYNLTIINDVSGIPFEEVFDNVIALFEDVVELKIFHNEEVVYNGELVTGTLQIESIASYFLLSNESDAYNNIAVYPNPFKDNLNISLADSDNAKISIYTIIGEKLIESNISGLTNQINTSSLEAGMYLMTVETDLSKSIKKIIKH